MPTKPQLFDHPELDDVSLQPAFEELRDAEHALTFARDRVTEAKAQLRTAVVEATAELRASGSPPPPALLDELYWDVPELRVVDIALALGVTAAELRVLVRPRVRDVDCRSCGEPMRALQRSRGSEIPDECDDCEAARRQRQAIANAIALQRQERDRLERHVGWDRPYVDEPWGPMWDADVPLDAGPGAPSSWDAPPLPRS